MSQCASEEFLVFGGQQADECHPRQDRSSSRPFLRRRRWKNRADPKLMSKVQEGNLTSIWASCSAPANGLHRGFSQSSEEFLSEISWL